MFLHNSWHFLCLLIKTDGKTLRVISGWVRINIKIRNLKLLVSNSSHVNSKHQVGAETYTTLPHQKTTMSLTWIYVFTLCLENVNSEFNTNIINVVFLEFQSKYFPILEDQCTTKVCPSASLWLSRFDSLGRHKPSMGLVKQEIRFSEVPIKLW